MELKTKNTIKRIAAMTTGAVMLGATMMHAAFAASSYTLADFPAPFVAAGKGDFTIVVGQDAKPDDIIGAVDVGVGLQASGGGASGQAAGVISGESVKIEEAGDPLNLDETFANVMTAGLDSSDLPTILADGNFKDSQGDTDNEESYTQEINFAADGPALVFDKNDDGDKAVADYVRIANNGELYSYVLEFDTDIDFVDDDVDAADDMENTQIEIQGRPYIITDFVYDAANDAIDEIELLTGETIITLAQGDTYTFEDHAVAITSVTEPDAPQEQCGISVDGETKYIDAGDDEEFGDLRVGVADIFAIHGAVGEDACEITLGSVLTKLVDGGEVQINGEDIGDRDGDPDVTTNVVIDAGAGTWGGFTITVDSDDEINLGSDTDGQDWTDPVFENFKISYVGLSGEVEDATFEAGTDDGTFTATNNEGKALEIQMFSVNEHSLFFGEDADAMLLIESDEQSADAIVALGVCNNANLVGGAVLLNEVTDYNHVANLDDVYANEDTVAIVQAAGLADITELENTLLLLSTEGQTARIVEITDIDVDNEQLSFKDITYGRTIDDVEPEGAWDLAGADMDFDLSGIGIITLSLVEDACDGNAAIAAIELVNGNLANGDDTELNFGDNAATLVDEGYETDGENIIVPDEESVDDDNDGDSDLWIGILESDNVDNTARSFVDTEMSYDDGEEEVLIDVPDAEEANAVPDIGTTAFATTGAFQDASDENDNDRYAMTVAGSLWHVNENDDGNIKDVDAKVVVGEAREGSAFVAETGALFTAPTTATETTTTTTNTAFTGAVARLDTEITDKTAVNMILIGGPCVNRLTAAVLAQTYPACGTEVATALGVPLDGAQIALYNNAFNGTKVAMTVMGTDAAGTRAASEVLKRYSEFKAQLTGMKVNVKSTAGVITVSAPTVA